MCGEQVAKDAPLAEATGSPPRVRGTEQGPQGIPGKGRITPACAGNRPLFPLWAGLARDHPRVCGEQHFLAHHQRQYLGSPPRVRGTGSLLQPVDPAGRITPACAGNSAPAAAKTAGPRDHPRVCGEQVQLVGSPIICRGSPPRVRGTDAIKNPGWVDMRITPACAGNRWR